MILNTYKIEKYKGIEIAEISCEHSDGDILRHDEIGTYATIVFTKKKRMFLNRRKPFLIYDCGAGSRIEITNKSNSTLVFGGNGVTKSSGFVLPTGITFRLRMKGKIYAQWW